MKTKFWISLLLLCCMTAALFTGCGKKNENTSSAAAEALQEESTADAEKTSTPVITIQGTVTAPENKSESAGPLLGAAADKNSENDYSVTEDAKFHSAVVSISQEEFEKAGFCLGDSVNIEFENGYSLSDVPYFNGYYVKNGNPVVVAYPGSASILITLNNEGIWEQAGLKDGDNVTITLNETGKYAAIQEALGQIYSFDRLKYPSDEAFCNFRALTGGNLKENYFFRGASPVDNSRNRAPYTDQLLKKAGIVFVMDLADSAEDLEAYQASGDFNSPYTLALYQDGKVVLLDMGSAYTSQVYQQKVAEGMRAMLQSEGPAYIHCMEGKDRTGFVCFLVEALAGASYEEMRADYMITYRNYYTVTPDESPEKYEAITELYFDAFVSYLHGTEDKAELVKADYTQDAAAYLMAGGMTEAEVQQLIRLITK